MRSRPVAAVIMGALLGLGLLTGDARAVGTEGGRNCDLTPAALTLHSPYLDDQGEAALAEAVATSQGVLDGVRRRSEPPGVPYSYLLYIPPGLPEGDVPLLVAMHGLGGHGPQFANQSGWATLADQHQFIVVFPSGTRRWDTNEGSVDVAFIRDVIAEVRAERCIDGRRIWATGHSYGGFMTQRLACDAGDLVAAGAVVSGGNITAPGIGGPCGAGTSASTRAGYEPVPLSFWHGTDDPIVSYESGRKSLQGWLARYACGTEPSEITALAYGTSETYSGCERTDIVARNQRNVLGERVPFAVTFRTYDGHGHGYPDGCGGIGEASTAECTEPDPSAWPTAETHNREILDFLFGQVRETAAPEQSAPRPVPVPSPSSPTDLVAWLHWFVESNRAS